MYDSTAETLICLKCFLDYLKKLLVSIHYEMTKTFKPACAGGFEERDYLSNGFPMRSSAYA